MKRRVRCWRFGHDTVGVQGGWLCQRCGKRWADPGLGAEDDIEEDSISPGLDPDDYILTIQTNTSPGPLLRVTLADLILVVEMSGGRTDLLGGPVIGPGYGERMSIEVERSSSWVIRETGRKLAEALREIREQEGG